MKRLLLIIGIVITLNGFSQKTNHKIALAKQKGKWGVIDTAGKWILQPVYEELGTIYEGVIPAREQSMWGLIDMKGNWILRPLYNLMRDFTEGYAIVAKKTHEDEKSPVVGLVFGMIDTKGKEVIPANSDFLGYLSEGMIVSRKTIDGNLRYGYVDIKGNWVIQPIFEEVNSFYCGRALVSEGNYEYHFIDKTGKQPFKIPDTLDIAPRGEQAHYENCMARVWDGKSHIFIDPMGKKISHFDTSVTFIDGFYSQNRCAVEVGEKNGYVDQNGKIVIKPIYDYTGSFIDGMAVVAIEMIRAPNTYKDGGKYGFIDLKGQWIGKPEFDFAFIPSEGIGAFQKGGRYGYINKNGKIFTETIYESLRNFSDGYGGFKLNGKWGFMNKDGKTVIEPVFDDIKSFKTVKY